MGPCLQCNNIATLLIYILHGSAIIHYLLHQVVVLEKTNIPRADDKTISHYTETHLQANADSGACFNMHYSIQADSKTEITCVVQFIRLEEPSMPLNAYVMVPFEAFNFIMALMYNSTPVKEEIAYIVVMSNDAEFDTQILHYLIFVADVQEVTKMLAININVSKQKALHCLISVADVQKAMMMLTTIVININVSKEIAFEIKLDCMLYACFIFVHNKTIKSEYGNLPKNEYFLPFCTAKYCEETKQLPDSLHREDVVNSDIDIIHHQESKSRNRIHLKFKIANMVSLLLSFFALVHSVSAQPSFDSKGTTGLFTEADLLFSNDMMWKAGCSYQYSMPSSISRSISPVNIELDQFYGSSDVYLSLQICGTRKSIIPKQIGNTKLNEDNDSTEDHHCTCITSLWQCSKEIIWVLIRTVFYGSFKTTGK